METEQISSCFKHHPEWNFLRHGQLLILATKNGVLVQWVSVVELDDEVACKNVAIWEVQWMELLFS